MSLDCPNSGTCEVGALLDEATILARLSDDEIKELGWESGTRVVIGAVTDTFAQLTDDQRREFNESIPPEDSRCDGCYLGRNALMGALLEDTPSTIADL